MSEDKPTLTKEELSGRLERLSFRPRQPKITPEQWMYRERAAVRVEYGLSDLQSAHATLTPADREAIQKVLAESTVIHHRDGRAAWRLRHGVRRETLERLAQQNRLRETLDANPASYPSVLQDMLDSYIRGHAPSLTEQTLDQLEATLQIVQWLDECLPALPSQDEIRRRMAHGRLLKPFHFLVGTHFQGRAEELQVLRQYIGVLSTDPAPAALQPGSGLERDSPLMVYGPGGIGKSTLVAKFILEHAEIKDERRFPYVYIDFNRRDIDIQEPISILLEAARQIAIQYPIDEERWKQLYADWSARVEESSAGTDRQASTKQEALASARLREWNRYVREFNSAMFSILKPGQPFLIVLDTLEELLYHNLEYLEELWNFLDNLKEAISSLRLVLSGRSPLPDRYPTHKLSLNGLDLQSAVALLLDLGIPEEAFALQVAETTGRSPLSLRLASDLYHRMHGDMKAFEGFEERQEYFYQVKEYLIQGLLYRRILGHLHDDDRRIQALAHPGLVLRRITPELIFDVLAASCDIEIRDLEDARDLFRKLRAEVSVVDIDQSDQNELRQRSELRLAMLELLRQDDPETVRVLHQQAAAYFRKRIEIQTPPSLRDLADEAYHRLALEEAPQFLDSYALKDLQAITDELGSAIQDLPAVAQTYLVSRVKVNIQIDPRVWASADLASWEHMTARNVKRLLNRRRYDEALTQLNARPDRSIGSPLYALEVLASVGIGQKDVAQERLEDGIRRSLPNSLQLQELFTLAASLDEEAQRFAAALERYRRAARIAGRRDDAKALLRIQLNIVRLTRVVYPQDSAAYRQEYTRLLEIWAAIRDADLLNDLTLVREVATQVGAESTEIVKRAVLLVGLGNERPTNLESLASALASWDDSRSAEHDEQPGLLARQVKAEWRGDLYGTWLGYLEEYQWDKVANELQRLVETHPLTPTLSITLIELIKARLLLTSQEADLLKSILLDAFTSDELQTLVQVQFDTSLSEISRGEDSDQRVADLLSWTESRGYMTKLLQALINQRPNHPQLAELLNALGIAYQSTPEFSDPEEAIRYYQSVLESAHARGDQNQAVGHVRLGDAYAARSEGDRADNFEQAIDHYQQALTVLTREAHPERWAAILVRLASSYAQRLRGDRAENLTQAIHYCQQALTVFTHETHPEDWADIQNNLGNLLQAQGDLRGARAAFERALEGYKFLYGQSHPKLAIILGNLGSVLFDQGDLTGARSAFERALDIDEATLGPDHPRVARYANNLGNVLQDLGDIVQAIRYYDRALALARQSGDRRIERKSLGNLANVYARTGDIDKAISYYEQQLTIAREMNDRRDESTALHNLGTVRRLVGETRMAIELYERALLITREIGDRAQEAGTLSNLGVAYADLGESHRAISYYGQALAISRAIGDRRGEGNILSNLGLVYASLGESHRAISYYEQALVISHESGDRSVEASTLGSLGAAYAGLGENHRAISYYEQALAISRAIGDRREEGNILGNLGLAYASLDESRRAILYYEQALAISRAIGDRRGEGNILGNLGLAYAGLGRSDQAIALCQEQLKIALDISDLRMQEVAFGNLGNIHFQMEAIGSAISYYQQALAIAIRIDDFIGEANLRFFLGLCYLETAAPRLAKSSLEAALKIYTEHEHPRAKEAQEFLQKAVEQENEILLDGINTGGGAYISGNVHVAGRDTSTGNVVYGELAFKTSDVKMDGGSSFGSELNDLMPAVCRAEFASHSDSYQTAFLVGPNLILTVYHGITSNVLEGRLSPHDLTFRFDLLATTAQEILSQGNAYALAVGKEAQARFQAERPWLLAADRELDYALLRLARPAGKEVPGGLRTGRPRGWLKLAEQAPLTPGDPLAAILFTKTAQLTIVYEEKAFIGYSDNRKQIAHRLKVSPETSGAPIITAWGEVVGLNRLKAGEYRTATAVPAIVADLKLKGIWPLP